MVKVRSLQKLIHDWRSYLSTPDADGGSEQLHVPSRTGRPLCADDFVKVIETHLVRCPRPRKPGPSTKGKDRRTADLLTDLGSDWS